eukprot:CAMPEP_0183594584 /NCGR_PEP_ID=MMETSP0371-20130417/171915_1 /TAXON_ID=268820 /ORGANISM="Peridinium aciculiferum, Strain PAER-2" /LENGTH=113 /DNA_ID=CAMNT_0025806313 /DNA_START=1 /DNA_END=343 /DNA_ORIENTATION=+
MHRFGAPAASEQQEEREGSRAGARVAPVAASSDGKLDANAVLEEHRLELVADALVHDRAVLVPAEVSVEALVGPSPADPANFPARQDPPVEAVEVIPKASHQAGLSQVHEGVA